MCVDKKILYKKKILLIAGSNHLNLHKMSLSQIKFKYHIFTPFLQIYSDDTKNIKINIVLQDYDNFLFCIKYSFSKLIILIVSLCIIWLGKFQIISFKLNVKIDNIIDSMYFLETKSSLPTSANPLRTFNNSFLSCIFIF